MLDPRDAALALVRELAAMDIAVSLDESCPFCGIDDVSREPHLADCWLTRARALVQQADAAGDAGRRAERGQ